MYCSRRARQQATAGAGTRALLKDRVLDVPQFLDALPRVSDGGSALDPEVVTARISETRRRDDLAALTTREIEVLALIAQGWTNTIIAHRLQVPIRTVETHVSAIMNKLGLAGTDEQNRRVLAVLAYLGRLEQRPNSP